MASDHGIKPWRDGADNVFRRIDMSGDARRAHWAVVEDEVRHLGQVTPVAGWSYTEVSAALVRDLRLDRQYFRRVDELSVLLFLAGTLASTSRAPASRTRTTEQLPHAGLAHDGDELAVSASRPTNLVSPCSAAICSRERAGPTPESS